MLVKARRDEFVNLCRDDRKENEGGTEKRKLQLGYEVFQQRCVLELRRISSTNNQYEWPHQHVEYLLGEEETQDEGNAEAEQSLDQPRAKLDQVIHQRG